ncbi:MAG: FtsX-like permease family protein [Vicinamibacterales bacterium]
MPASGVADRDRQALGASLGTVYAFTLLLFLVTCANLAGVMQARLASRRRDVAIRLSLGAGRGRLVREWIVECLVLATAGGAASLLVARLTAAVVGRLQPPGGVVGGFAFDACRRPRRRIRRRARRAGDDALRRAAGLAARSRDG